MRAFDSNRASCSHGSTEGTTVDRKREEISTSESEGLYQGGGTCDRHKLGEIAHPRRGIDRLHRRW